jgi:hypothetical protein
VTGRTPPATNSLDADDVAIAAEAAALDAGDVVLGANEAAPDADDVVLDPEHAPTRATITTNDRRSRHATRIGRS